MAGSKKCARSMSTPQREALPRCRLGARVEPGDERPAELHLALARLLGLDPVGAEVEERLRSELLHELHRHRQSVAARVGRRETRIEEVLGPEAEQDVSVRGPEPFPRSRRELEPVGRELDRAAGEPGAEEVHRRAADEAGHEACSPGGCRARSGRVDLLDDAAVEHGHALAERHRLDLVVRDVQRRHTELAVELHDLRAHLHAQLRVEVGERLVHQERRRVADDRAAHRHPLALAARELRAACARGARRSRVPRPRLDPPRAARPCAASASAAGSRCCRTRSCAGRARSSGRPSRRRARRGSSVVDDAAADEDLVRRRDLLEPGDHPQRRRLPAARRADEDHELAVVRSRGRGRRRRRCRRRRPSSRR